MTAVFAQKLPASRDAAVALLRECDSAFDAAIAETVHSPTVRVPALDLNVMLREQTASVITHAAMRLCLNTASPAPGNGVSLVPYEDAFAWAESFYKFAETWRASYLARPQDAGSPLSGGGPAGKEITP